MTASPIPGRVGNRVVQSNGKKDKAGGADVQVSRILFEASFPYGGPAAAYLHAPRSSRLHSHIGLDVIGHLGSKSLRKENIYKIVPF